MLVIAYTIVLNIVFRHSLTLFNFKHILIYLMQLSKKRKDSVYYTN